MDYQANSRLLFLPVTAERLPDLEAFSNCHGKFRYCSCMRWRMASSAFRRSTKEDRVAALEALVRAGTAVGILAYSGSTPVGWCSVAPRASYAALERSRVLPRVDDMPVWSVVCLFVDRHFRRQGLTGRLLQAAVDYARDQGAPAVEGYPVAPDAPSYKYMGTPETYRRAGFQDVTPAGQKRMVMRYNLLSEKGPTF